MDRFRAIIALLKSITYIVKYCFFRMGEARRRSEKGLQPRSKKSKNKSPRIVPWFPVTLAQRDQFIQLSIRAGWVGIVLLVILWIVVRIIGPAAGWWIPADSR
tara:strand:- start:344 stop:652 length:309 start_codon:yes stop_codon:yes gene_type:complete